MFSALRVRCATLNKIVLVVIFVTFVSRVIIVRLMSIVEVVIRRAKRATIVWSVIRAKNVMYRVIFVYTAKVLAHK